MKGETEIIISSPVICKSVGKSGDPGVARCYDACYGSKDRTID